MDTQRARKNPRKLTSAEADLWREATRDVRRRKPRPHVIQEQIAEAAPDPAVSHAPRMKPQSQRPKAVQPPAAPQLKPLTALDVKTRRRMRQGGQEVEARIDLHGMRQDAAHAALRDFIIRSHNSGLRMVLVITGKGKPEAESFNSAGDSSGVLRRAAPLWLADPSLRMLVSGYGVAERVHGGEGALYVRIRRRRA